MVDHLAKVAIDNLYMEAQLAASMDSEVTVKGNGHSPFAVKQTLEEVAGWLNIPLTKLDRQGMEDLLRNTGREHEIEYLEE